MQTIQKMKSYKKTDKQRHKAWKIDRKARRLAAQHRKGIAA